MSIRTKYRRAVDPQILRLEVVRRESISPHVIRVTLGGDALAGFHPQGADQWFRLFLPRPGQSSLTLPSVSSALWYPQVMVMSRATRPAVRNYTVRALRAGAGEMDIDFISHGDAGEASAWARATTAGNPAAVLDQGICYLPSGPGRQLLVGEESAMPALLGILASAPVDLRADVFIEVPDPSDAQPVTAPLGVTVNWLARKDSGELPGTLALRTALHAVTGIPAYTFVAGENSLVTGLRRGLVARGAAKSSVAFIGYWRHGKVPPGMA